MSGVTGMALTQCGAHAKAGDHVERASKDETHWPRIDAKTTNFPHGTLQLELLDRGRPLSGAPVVMRQRDPVSLVAHVIHECQDRASQPAITEMVFDHDARARDTRALAQERQRIVGVV